MALGIRAVLDRLTTIVRGVTPKESPDWPFTCVGDGTGLVQDLESRPSASSIRFFEWRLTEAPTDYGIAGGVAACAVQALLTLRVWYPVTGDRRLLEIMLAEDVQRLTVAVMAPSSWQTATTGLDHITPPPGASLDFTETENGGGVLTIPFLTQYREAA